MLFFESVTFKEKKDADIYLNALLSEGIEAHLVYSKDDFKVIINGNS